MFERRRAAREHADDERRLAEFIVRHGAVHVEPTPQEQVGRQHGLAPIQVGEERRWGAVGGGTRVGTEGNLVVGILQ